jgi:DNA modification methylase
MTPYFASSDVTIYCADSRTAWERLPEHSADAIVTSPPYFGLRDYGHDGQIGLEESPQDYIEGLADLLTGYGSRVLRPGGSLWLNLGDTYSTGSSQPGWSPPTTGLNGPGADRMGNKPIRGVADFPTKCLLMIPERVALALIERGWILRNRVVWAKPNGMPSSVRDRLATKHEALFHLVRQPRYFYNLDAIKDPVKDPTAADGSRVFGGKNKGHLGGVDATERTRGHNVYEGGDGKANPGDVWTIPTQPYPDAHFAVFPPELVRRPILATVPEGGTVLDPFFGSGTTAVMARRLGRKAVGVELSESYCELAAKRFQQQVFDFGGAA